MTSGTESTGSAVSSVKSTAFLEANTRNRDEFLGELISELGDTLEDVVGLSEAENFVKVVGLKVGEAIYADYTKDQKDEKWTVEQLAAALVDLKRKIKGGFSVERIESDRIVLVNDCCPFGDRVKGRPSLCQMTSSVFGKIAAEQFDYAKVEVDKAIAKGDGYCRVIVNLSTDSAGDSPGVEFYKS